MFGCGILYFEEMKDYFLIFSLNKCNEGSLINFIKREETKVNETLSLEKILVGKKRLFHEREEIKEFKEDEIKMS